MKYALILSALILAGCSTTAPVVAKFPEAPETLLTTCPDLQKLEADAKLSDVARVVNNNYSKYYECAVRHDAFIEWYHIQKKIFEDLK